MILPIVLYGSSVLRKKTLEVTKDQEGLDDLITNMWETLYHAEGVGLAAPQVNSPLSIFIVDSMQTYHAMTEEERVRYFKQTTGIQETFINARITESSAETWTDTEGCLSIPSLAEEVERAWSITIRYFDRKFNQHTKTFGGTTARIIQHEYDHTQGILYLDHLKPLKRQLLKNKLKKISEGKVTTTYRIKSF